jgi:hypothetical protein
MIASEARSGVLDRTRAALAAAVADVERSVEAG